MLNIENDVVVTGSPVVRMATTPPGRAVQTVTITPLAQPPATAYLMRECAQWTWQDLRDFVVGEIMRCFGAIPRNGVKEKSIFSSFLDRWPDGKAGAIAKLAFSAPYNGWWKGAPVSVNRFCKASDQYFATELAAKLVT